MDALGALLGIVMGWCYNLVNNYGMAIILFTLFSKFVLLPISIWVQFNSIKMVKMQPALNRIKIDHFGDKDTIAEETQKLYKKNHYEYEEDEKDDEKEKVLSARIFYSCNDCIIRRNHSWF